MLKYADLQLRFLKNRVIINYGVLLLLDLSVKVKCIQLIETILAYSFNFNLTFNNNRNRV